MPSHEQTAVRVVQNLIDRCEALETQRSCGDCSIQTSLPKAELEARCDELFSSISVADAKFCIGRLEQRVRDSISGSSSSGPASGEPDPVLLLFKELGQSKETLGKLDFVQNFRQTEMMNIWGFIVSVLEIDDGGTIKKEDLQLAMGTYADGRFQGDLSRACEHVKQSAARERSDKQPAEEGGIELSKTDHASRLVKKLHKQVSDPDGSNFRKLKFMLGIMQFFEEDSSESGMISYEGFQQGVQKMADERTNGDLVAACKTIRDGFTSLQRTGRLRLRCKCLTPPSSILDHSHAISVPIPEAPTDEGIELGTEFKRAPPLGMSPRSS